MDGLRIVDWGNVVAKGRPTIERRDSDEGRGLQEKYLAALVGDDSNRIPWARLAKQLEELGCGREC